mgnify:CR=1 FL=1
MSEERRYEQRRDEKQEKNEKGEDESWDEKWRRDPVDAAMWAIILIWAGVALLASQLGWFKGLPMEAWAIGFLGAGIIVLLTVLFRLLVPAYRKPLAGYLVLGLVFVGIGLGETVGWVIIGPLVLIGIGLGILFTGLFRNRE